MEPNQPFPPTPGQTRPALALVDKGSDFTHRGREPTLASLLATFPFTTSNRRLLHTCLTQRPQHLPRSREVWQIARLNRVPACFKRVMWSPWSMYQVHYVRASGWLSASRCGAPDGSVHVWYTVQAHSTGGMKVGPVPPLASALASLPYHLNMPHIIPWSGTSTAYPMPCIPHKSLSSLASLSLVTRGLVCGPSALRSAEEKSLGVTMGKLGYPSQRASFSCICSSG